jgi:hypothetical protein
MHEPDRRIDEQALAAFLAGSLTPRRREEMISLLAADPEARELLCMAHSALRAAQTSEGETGVPDPVSRTHRSPERPRRDRPVMPRTSPRVPRAYAVAATIVAAVALAIFLRVDAPTDPLRRAVLPGGERLDVDVTTPGPNVAWSPEIDAYHYRLVVWDPEETRVVGRYETRDVRLTQNHAIVQDLRTKLRPGTSYLLRVDAIDAQNRLIRSSPAVTFVFD